MLLQTRMVRLALWLSLALGAQTISAQTLVSRWAHNLGGPGNNSPFGITNDNDGNIFVGSYPMGDTLRFDRDTLVFDSQRDPLHFAIELAKYGPTGDLLWHREYYSNSWMVSAHLVTDGQGGVIVMLNYTGEDNWVFDTDTAGSPNLSLQDTYATYFLRVDSTGKIAWRKEGIGLWPWPTSFSGEANGNFSFEGVVGDTAYFLSPGDTTVLLRDTSTTLHSRAVSITLDASGRRVQITPLIPSIYANRIMRSPSGAVTMWSSLMKGTVVVGSDTIESALFYQNAVVCRLDSSGSVLWSVPVLSSNSVQAYSLATDADGNTYCTGTWAGNRLQIRGYILSQDSDYSSTWFIMKIDPAGTVLWAKRLWNPGGANPGYDPMLTISADRVLVGGVTESSIVIGSDTIAQLQNPSTFLGVLSTEGELKRIVRISDAAEGGVPSNRFPLVMQLPNGDLAVTTGFTGWSDLGHGQIPAPGVLVAEFGLDALSTPKQPGPSANTVGVIVKDGQLILNGLDESDSPIEVSITDLLGRECLKSSIDRNSPGSITVSQLTSGLYFLRLESRSKRTAIRKLLVQ